MITRGTDGSLSLWRGNGAGQLAGPSMIGSRLRQGRPSSPAGDVTGDGFPDLLGTPADGALMV